MSNEQSGAADFQAQLVCPAPSAMQQLTAALKADPEYAWAWHCNIAMPIMDSAKVSHRVANVAAARLMLHLFGIDTEQHPHFQVADEQPAQQQEGLREALVSAKQAINSMKVEAETAAQGDEQMMLEACEDISNEGLAASQAIDAALARNEGEAG